MIAAEFHFDESIHTALCTAQHRHTTPSNQSTIGSTVPIYQIGDEVSEESYTFNAIETGSQEELGKAMPWISMKRNSPVIYRFRGCYISRVYVRGRICLCRRVLRLYLLLSRSSTISEWWTQKGREKASLNDGKDDDDGQWWPIALAPFR